MKPLWLDLGIRGLVDVLVVAFFVWLGIRYLRRTRARVALLGLGMLGVVYLVARWLSLELTAALFQGFFAVVVLVVVVVFQDDLHRLFEQLGAYLGSARKRDVAADDDADLLTRTVVRLAASRTGALAVLPGREPIERHLEGGVALAGRLSEALLLSLFDTSSPGHDGALLLGPHLVERFAVHLPLSSDHAQLGQRGTRHAAALGLAERCDAFCIVVSEERGTVSVAHAGVLRTLARPEDLAGELRRFRTPEPEGAVRWRDGSTWAEPAAARVLASALWFVFVPGATRVTVEVPARVIVENLPEDFELESVDPPLVDVRLSGRRRDLLLAFGSEVSVRIDGHLVGLGRRTFDIDNEQVVCPKEFDVVGINPSRARVSVLRTGSAALQRPRDAA